jgi:hypothetical protein
MDKASISTPLTLRQKLIFQHISGFQATFPYVIMDVFARLRALQTKSKENFHSTNSYFAIVYILLAFESTIFLLLFRGFLRNAKIKS